MITLRDEQLAALRDRAARAFREAVARQLRRLEPAATAARSARDLDRLLAAGVRRARAHGVLLPADLRGYLRLVVRHGAELDREQEWARRALSAVELSGSQKVARLRVAEPRG